MRITCVTYWKGADSLMLDSSEYFDPDQETLQRDSVLKAQLLLWCIARLGSKCGVSCRFRSISSAPGTSDS